MIQEVERPPTPTTSSPASWSARHRRSAACATTSTDWPTSPRTSALTCSPGSRNPAPPLPQPLLRRRGAGAMPALRLRQPTSSGRSCATGSPDSVVATRWQEGPALLVRTPRDRRGTGCPLACLGTGLPPTGRAAHRRRRQDRWTSATTRHVVRLTTTGGHACSLTRPRSASGRTARSQRRHGLQGDRPGAHRHRQAQARVVTTSRGRPPLDLPRANGDGLCDRLRRPPRQPPRRPGAERTAPSPRCSHTHGTPAPALNETCGPRRVAR